MRLKQLFLLHILALTLVTSATAQKNRIAIGTQIPMNYSASYEEYIAGGIYVNYHFGYLTNPYVKVLFHEAEKRGLDPEFSQLLKGYFKQGISHQFQLKYAPSFFRGFYLGGLFKRKTVTCIEIPYLTAADHFNIDLTPYLNDPIFLAIIDDLDFRITMNIPGFYIGKSIPLGKSNWSVYMEASFMKIISSTSLASFTGSETAVPLLNDPLNEEIRASLDEDGNLYSFNIGFSYTLPVSINSGVQSLGRGIGNLFKKKEKSTNASD